MPRLITRLLCLLILVSTGAVAHAADANKMDKVSEPASEKKTDAAKLPTERTNVQLQGWTLRVDDRLFLPANEELRLRALRFIENKLSDIIMVVPKQQVEKLQKVTIVLDLTHGKLGAMQYHPSAGWLKANGYSPDLARCVHLPRAMDVATKRNTNGQPWVLLHELAHAYHDQVLGFDHEQILKVYENYKKSGRGDMVLHHTGSRGKHYALTTHKEFFAEMTEAYFGVNDFYPFVRGELKDSEPETHELLREIWETAKAPAKSVPGDKP